MEIIITETYEELSGRSAMEAIRLTSTDRPSLICPASGDSTAGMYKALVDLSARGKADLSRWTYVGLDEWMGMNGNDEGSCRYHLDRQLFQPLEVPKQKIRFFDGRAADPEKECQEVEDFIASHGGIDVVILGLGMNGHIGMNEPGASASLRSHLSQLDPMTQAVGQKYFKQQQSLTQGITLGIASILAAKNIIVLVSGEHKAEIAARVLSEEISDALPGTFLRRHPALTIYLDEAAAKFIK
ncbi:MAG: glucosamine-6-phosphate deaminase [Chitinophagaceae bacterium]|nr:glucosamine-6-phosphate deaminase [Chitinophagaceae bacterium]